ncbi:MAG: hypothetical protein ACQESR_31180, partial [Planctomycetota bacterium]
ESCPTQAVLPLVGLAAEKVIRDRYIFQAVEFFRVESCPTQAVLPLVGLAAEKVIRDRYKGRWIPGFPLVGSGPHAVHFLAQLHPACAIPGHRW